MPRLVAGGAEPGRRGRRPWTCPRGALGAVCSGCGSEGRPGAVGSVDRLQALSRGRRWGPEGQVHCPPSPGFPKPSVLCPANRGYFLTSCSGSKGGQHAGPPWAPPGCWCHHCGAEVGAGTQDEGQGPLTPGWGDERLVPGSKQAAGVHGTAPRGGWSSHRHTTAGLSLAHKGSFSRTVEERRPFLLMCPARRLPGAQRPWAGGLAQERKNPRHRVEQRPGGGPTHRPPGQARGAPQKGQLWGHPEAWLQSAGFEGGSHAGEKPFTERGGHGGSAAAQLGTARSVPLSATQGAGPIARLGARRPGRPPACGLHNPARRSRRGAALPGCRAPESVGRHAALG